MRIFISAGEPSGDLHAANLVAALRERVPDAEFLGFGGPRLEAAGATLLYPLVELAVMWFGRVLLNLHRFLGVVRLADRTFREHRPDAVVLIDYPGLHWWLARKAKAQGIPVFYYVPPQLWAWAGWRVAKVRKFVDHVLCSLPFEPDWYARRGVPGARYVGHPYFDELAERHLDTAFLAEQTGQGGPVVAILPGSRTQEVTRNLPELLRAAAKVARARPETRFVVACHRDRHAELARELARSLDSHVRLEVHAGRTPELIRLADVAWAVSGSVSLELMAEQLPTIILYKIRAFDLWLARKFIKARFITLVNLLADEEVMPEYLTAADVSDELAAQALVWLNDRSAREHAAANLGALRDRFAVPGASRRAAAAIAEVLQRRAPHPPVAGPHFPTTSAPVSSDRA